MIDPIKEHPSDNKYIQLLWKQRQIHYLRGPPSQGSENLSGNQDPGPLNLPIAS